MTIEELNKLSKSSKEAKPLGSKYYFTGKPCRRGHVCERRSDSGACVICQYECDKRYYQENSEHKKEYLKRYYRENPEKKKEYAKKYRQKNPEKVREYSKRYQKNRRKNDPCFRLRRNFSSAVANCLTSCKQGYSCFDLVDYTFEQLKQHLESQFTDGMTWENYGEGGWVVDHIVPQCSFQFESYNTPEFKACWALSNLRPLWEAANLKKIKEDRKLSWKIVKT